MSEDQTQDLSQESAKQQLIVHSTKEELAETVVAKQEKEAVTGLERRIGRYIGYVVGICAFAVITFEYRLADKQLRQVNQSIIFGCACVMCSAFGVTLPSELIGKFFTPEKIE